MFISGRFAGIINCRGWALSGPLSYRHNAASAPSKPHSLQVGLLPRLGSRRRPGSGFGAILVRFGSNFGHADDFGINVGITSLLNFFFTKLLYVSASSHHDILTYLVCIASSRPQSKRHYGQFLQVQAHRHSSSPQPITHKRFAPPKIAKSRQLLCIYNC